MLEREHDRRVGEIRLPVLSVEFESRQQIAEDIDSCEWLIVRPDEGPGRNNAVINSGCKVYHGRGDDAVLEGGGKVYRS